METKQVILIRSDLRMRRGKEYAQFGHATQAWMTQKLLGFFTNGKEVKLNWFSKLLCKVFGFWPIYKTALNEEEFNWLTTGTTKIVLKCTSEAELLEIDWVARTKGLNTFLVRDSGHTEVPPGTITALAIGPHEVSKFEGITNELQLY